MATLNASAPAAAPTPAVPTVVSFTPKTFEELALMSPAERKAYRDEVKKSQESIRQVFGYVDGAKKDKLADARADLLAEFKSLPDFMITVGLGNREFKMPISEALAPDETARHEDISVVKEGKEEIRNMTVVLQSFRVNQLSAAIQRLKKAMANEMIRGPRTKKDKVASAPAPAVPAPVAKKGKAASVPAPAAAPVVKGRGSKAKTRIAA